MSKIEVDAIEPQSGTTLTVGASGKTIIIPSGATLNASNSTVTLPASAVFDDNNIINDISTLALRQASDADRVAYNTNSSFVDVFQDSTGIDTTTNTSRNVSEYVSSEIVTLGSPSYDSGDRTSTYTVTTNGVLHTGSPAISALVDGITSGQLLVLQNGASQTGVFIRFDRGSGNSAIYQGAKFIMQNTDFQAGSAWSWEGSNDNITYTTLLSGQSWGGSNPQEFSWSNTTAYRYLQFIDKTGSAITTNYNNYNYEWEFFIATATATFNATGNFTGTTITAPSSVSSMGAIITYQDNAGTNALNTDIVLELSADNGSNWSTATLSALPNFSTGIKMAKVNDLAVTAGTQLKYRLNFANQASGTKEARIRGVALQY